MLTIVLSLASCGTHRTITNSEQRTESRTLDQADALLSLQTSVQRLETEVSELKTASERNDSARVSETETTIKEVYDTDKPGCPVKERTTTVKGRDTEAGSRLTANTGYTRTGAAQTAVVATGSGESHKVSESASEADTSQKNESRRRTLPWWAVMTAGTLLAVLILPTLYKGMRTLLKRFLKTD